MAVQERARDLNSSHRVRGRRARAAVAALSALALLAACGGGGDAGTGAASPVALPGVQVSAASPVAAGCNGGRGSGEVFVNAEIEPFIAASPARADVLVGIWQQDRASDGGARAVVSAWSADGGHTWGRTLHPFSRCGGAATGEAGDFERASDPWVDVSPDGTVHAMALAFSGIAFREGAVSAMLASRSTDGGRTWSAPRVLQRDGAGFFNDKNTLTADPTDARHVYAVWDRLDGDGNGPTLLARSADGGQTWEGTRTIVVPEAPSGISQTIGNRIVVIPDGPERGVLVNVYNQIDTVQGVSRSRVRVVRSRDRGLSWSEPVTVDDMRAVGARDPLTGRAIRDGAVIPVIAAGRGGRLWIAWQDARFSGGQRDAIALTRSDDGGLTWSTAVAVNRDLSVPAFTPTLHVQADGRLAVMHLDLRSNGAGAPTPRADLWLLSTTNGVDVAERALARDLPLHAAPLVTGGLFLGDYHGLASAGSDLVALAALPTGRADDRTDVVAIRVEPPAASAAAAARGVTAFRARAAPLVPPPGALDAAAHARATSAAIEAALRARPGQPPRAPH